MELKEKCKRDRIGTVCPFIACAMQMSASPREAFCAGMWTRKTEKENKRQAGSAESTDVASSAWKGNAVTFTQFSESSLACYFTKGTVRIEAGGWDKKNVL